jgi:hypothetical protein
MMCFVFLLLYIIVVVCVLCSHETHDTNEIYEKKVSLLRREHGKLFVSHLVSLVRHPLWDIVRRLQYRQTLVDPVFAKGVIFGRCKVWGKN